MNQGRLNNLARGVSRYHLSTNLDDSQQSAVTVSQWDEIINPGSGATAPDICRHKFKKFGSGLQPQCRLVFSIMSPELVEFCVKSVIKCFLLEFFYTKRSKLEKKMGFLISSFLVKKRSDCNLRRVWKKKSIKIIWTERSLRLCFNNLLLQVYCLSHHCQTVRCCNI